MKYRRLDSGGDYTLGSNLFLKDSPDAVAQAVRTNYELLKGEWFLDTTFGFDTGQVLGVSTQQTRDLEVQRVALTTIGVTSLASYQSSVAGRAFAATMTLETLYGNTTTEINYGL